jgi:hypothetical protein
VDCRLIIVATTRQGGLMLNLSASRKVNLSRICAEAGGAGEGAGREDEGVVFRLR